MYSVNISDFLKTPQIVVISIPSHTRSIFHSAKMIFFDFFEKNKISCFKLFWHLSLNIVERFNWIRWTFIFKLFRFHSLWNWIRFLAQARKQNKRWRSFVREWDQDHSSICHCVGYIKALQGTESPMMQLWPVRGWWIKFLPSERRVQNHWAQRMGILRFWMRLKQNHRFNSLVLKEKPPEWWGLQKQNCFLRSQKIVEDSKSPRTLAL